jgi:hypothetical protein
MACRRFRQKPFAVLGDITNKANTLARPIEEFLELWEKSVRENR